MPETAPRYEAFEAAANRRLHPAIKIASGALALACVMGAEGGCGANDGGGEDGAGTSNCDIVAKDTARSTAHNAMVKHNIIPKQEIPLSYCTMNEDESLASFGTDKFRGQLAKTRCFVSIKAKYSKGEGTHWTVHGFGNGGVNDEIWRPFRDKSNKNKYKPDLSRIPIINAARNGGKAAKFAVSKCTAGTGL